MVYLRVLCCGGSEFLAGAAVNGKENYFSEKIAALADNISGKFRLLRCGLPYLAVSVDPLFRRKTPPWHHFKHDKVLSTCNPLRFFAGVRHQDLVARAISSLEDIAAAQTRRWIDPDHDISSSPNCPRLRVRMRFEIRELLNWFSSQRLLAPLVLQERELHASFVLYASPTEFSSS